jgi:hypothetical protein
LLSAINELTFNKNYPLNEFFTYLGSFTSPPCIEDVTYIINPKPLLAPLDQIIEVSKVISQCSSFGNNRNIQKAEGREIFQFENQNEMEAVFDQLNLIGEITSEFEDVDYFITGERRKSKRFNPNELFKSASKSGSRISSLSSHHHPLINKHECNDEDLIDKIIDAKDKDVELFLKNNNLK